ncbi:hypothetical protein L9F63_024494 [Diploptera punctata]|uniref:Peptidase S1 domain-containing protein n=1 Tax=Diploptera punctata TaxID=6984 RepID=A0AAD7ZF71_DIPPU|nr:hypothetical protein L9F63_024494 [Diploptera punctata]
MFADGTLSNELLEIQVSVLPNEDCRWPLINSSIICAGDEIGGKNPYHGDSGGPLMIKYDGRWIQIGVTSMSHEYETPYLPAMYVRVTEYMDWIQENILD